MKRRNKIFIFTLVLLFLLFWITLVFMVSPEKIVETIGAANGYLAAFALALVIGVSSFTSVSFYAAIITFALGGLNIFLLALLGGLGMALGDSFFYYLGFRGKQAIPEKWEKRAEKISVWICKKPPALIGVFIFIYVSFTPFSVDVLTAFLGLIGFSYKKIILPLLLGHIVFITLISFLAKQGFSIVN